MIKRESPDVLLMRNVDTPHDPNDHGSEYSIPSEKGRGEIEEAADYINEILDGRPVFVATSPWTLRSQEAGKLLAARLEHVDGGGSFAKPSSERPALSLPTLAQYEAFAMEQLLYYQELLRSKKIGEATVTTLFVATGAGISRYLGLDFSWDKGTQDVSPWQNPLFGKNRPSGNVLLPTGAVVIPERDKENKLVIRGHGVDLLTEFLAEKRKK